MMNSKNVMLMLVSVFLLLAFPNENFAQGKLMVKKYKKKYCKAQYIIYS